MRQWAVLTSKPAIAVAVLAALALSAVVVAAIQSRQLSVPVYTPGQVKAGLSQNPGAWVGRTVLVRGTLIDVGLEFPHAPNLQPAPLVLAPPIPPRHLLGLSPTFSATLIYVMSLKAGEVLVLQRVQPDSVISLLRNLPLAGRLFPPAKHVNTFSPAVYRVQILAPNPSCTPISAYLVRACYDALLTVS